MHATEAEKKVLGALLHDPDKIAKEAEEIGLHSNHFGVDLHKKGWDLLFGRASGGETIEPSELGIRCSKELKELDGEITGLALVGGWQAETPSTHHFKEHAGIVIEAANRRRTEVELARAMAKTKSGESLEEVAEILTNAATVANAPLVASNWSLADEIDGMIASTSEHLEEMEKLSSESVFVLPKIAISGQITIINAGPNAGKTLLTCWLLSQRDQQAKESHKVYYINADDTFDGGRFKAEFMKQHGVESLIPDQRGFSLDKFKIMLERAITTKTAGGVVFILDTLKKFVDMMDKKAARSMNDLLRRFVQSGGTIIALAHVNKNKDGDGSSVAEGVGDFLNDFDAAYVIEVAGESESGTRTIVFKNTKSRGPNAKKATFTYSNAEEVKWLSRFQSVVSIDGDEAARNIARLKAEQHHSQDKLVIDYICQRLQSGALSRKEICQTDLTNGVSRQQREKVLERYSGDNGGENKVYWKASKGKTGGWVYSLA